MEWVLSTGGTDFNNKDCCFLFVFWFDCLFSCQSPQYLEQGCEARKPTGWSSWHSHRVHHPHGSHYSIQTIWDDKEDEVTGGLWPGNSLQG